MFEDQVDSKMIVKEVTHENMLQLFVDDVSKYIKDEAAYEDLLDSMFDHFDDKTFRNVIGETNGLIDEGQHCKHLAEGKSLFDLDDLQSVSKISKPRDQENQRREQAAQAETETDTSTIKDDL